jgi:glycosyltransferase involved in cell wall biosynthesis
MGSIVLGTNHGGTAEIITSNKDGYLFEPSNTHDFCESLQRILQTPAELLVEVSKNAKERAQIFSQQNFLDNTLKVYDELL